MGSFGWDLIEIELNSIKARDVFIEVFNSLMKEYLYQEEHSFKDSDFQFKNNTYRACIEGDCLFKFSVEENVLETIKNFIARVPSVKCSSKHCRSDSNGESYVKCKYNENILIITQKRPDTEKETISYKLKNNTWRIIERSAVTKSTVDGKKTGLSKEWKYEKLKNGTICLSEYKGSDTDVIVPAEMDSTLVSTIGADCFFGKTKIKSVILPESVTKVKSGAFNCCESLKTIIINSKKTSFEWRAFNGCIGLSDNQGLMIIGNTLVGILTESLTKIINVPEKIVVPEGVTDIEEGAFQLVDKITTVILPDGVKRIKGCAFYCCNNLVEVFVPASVAKIGKYVFDDCPNLTIHAPAGSYAEQYAKENNIPFIAE